MTRPKRIQRRRAKGWRKPEGAVIVDRTSGWGNPFKVGDPGIPDAETAVRKYAESLTPYRHSGEPVGKSKLDDYLVSEATIDAIRSELRGKDLVCWCPLDQPCHADILLEIANER